MCGPNFCADIGGKVTKLDVEIVVSRRIHRHCDLLTGWHCHAVDILVARTGSAGRAAEGGGKGSHADCGSLRLAVVGFVAVGCGAGGRGKGRTHCQRQIREGRANREPREDCWIEVADTGVAIATQVGQRLQVATIQIAAHNGCALGEVEGILLRADDNATRIRAQIFVQHSHPSPVVVGPEECAAIVGWVDPVELLAVGVDR